MARVLGALWWLTVVLVWTVTVGGGAEAEYVKYKVAVKARIQDLMSRMSLEEKIGQMAQIDRLTATPETMQTYSIGSTPLFNSLITWCFMVLSCVFVFAMVEQFRSVLSDGGSAPLPEASAEDWVNMCGRKLTFAIYQSSIRHTCLFYMLWTHRDPDLVKRIGSATATEVRATGIPYVFAPCVATEDLNSRSLFDHFHTYAKCISAIRITFALAPYFYHLHFRDKVAVCAKHFVGDGGTTKGINKNNTLIDRHGLLSMHMPAYSDSVIKGVSTIMVSYSSWNGEKMHANRELIAGFLKDTLKFKLSLSTSFNTCYSFILTCVCGPGFVISDWQGIDRITSPPHSNYTYSVEAAIQARIDMVMLPYNHTEFIDDLTYLVKNNVIPMDRIDDAVEKILLVKFSLGLFEKPLDDLSLVNELGSQLVTKQQCHDDKPPLKYLGTYIEIWQGKLLENHLYCFQRKLQIKILVAGTHADNLGYQYCGGWTINWQGFDGNNYTRGTTILDAIKSAVDPKTEIIFQEVPDTKFVKTNNFSYAIVVVGEPPYAESAGDSEDLTMKDPGPSVISNVCGTVKCVVVIISGRPIVIEPYVSSIDALVAAWLPGTEGQGQHLLQFQDDHMCLWLLFPSFSDCTWPVRSNLGNYELEATREPEKPPEIGGSRLLDGDMYRAPLTYSVEAAIQARIDMVMLPYNHTEFIDDLTYLVKNNVIPMDRIDDAVEKILLVKFSLGLFELDVSRYLPRILLGLGRMVGNPVKIDIQTQTAERGQYARVAVELFYNLLGFHSLNRFCLETTYSSSFIYFIPLIGTTILDAIKSAVDPKTEIIFQEVPDTKFVKSNNFAYAIVVVGEPPYAESAGDSEDLTMKDPGPSVISNVCGTVKCVVVIISGRPIVIEPYVSSIDALLAANWLPGTEGQGVTYVLFGDYGFTGKLPRTWFKTVDQLPMNVGDAHYDPLFPFDFGLTTKSGPSIVGSSEFINRCHYCFIFTERTWFYTWILFKLLVLFLGQHLLLFQVDHMCLWSLFLSFSDCTWPVKSNLGSYEPEATREPEKPLEIDGSRVLDDMRRAPLGFC
ncbi:hypothetical protein Tsubulata_043187 [Turnera subulata]|uniref:Fibronectin type III-like domain-containing protein n=1 Tax=Turnera subulata TaxID=218843 RepID=A0A9Q0JPU3_9ROSI|nr:hypothetical protein Tsubulata_043187 [Turnera subulata]